MSITSNALKASQAKQNAAQGENRFSWHVPIRWTNGYQIYLAVTCELLYRI